MRILAGLGGLVLIGMILIDTFEAVLLPHRVTHGFRFARFFYRNSWLSWRRLVGVVKTSRRRESLLSLFGPLALLVLFATWAIGLVFAFAFVHWSLHSLTSAGDPARSINEYLYFSGVTFFTLGYGDLVPAEDLGRFLAVFESGLGFGFLAIIISYHPVLTQAFSRRELVISLLDARGGSPPTAAQILIRSHSSQQAASLAADMAAWEVWCGELLESCLSFPVLAYYRSQHDNQSWLAALTAMLDTSALEICGVCEAHQYQARLTFAIARHAAVDLALVFKITPVAPQPDRLGAESLKRLLEMLEAAGMCAPADSATAVAKLAELRGMYEPFVNGLSQYFLMRIPDFFPARPTADNWQTSAWMPRTPGILELPNLERGEHFE